MKNLSIAFLTVASLFTFGCKKGDDVAAAVAKSEQFAAEMCKCTDKACTDKVHADYTAFAEQMRNSSVAKAKADEAMKAKMRAARDKYLDCKNKVGGAAAAPAEGEGAAAAEGEGAAAAGDLPQECQDYKAAIESLAKCDKMPAASKDALRQGFEQAWAAWTKMPAETKAALADACKTSVDTVKQIAVACN